MDLAQLTNQFNEEAERATLKHKISHAVSQILSQCERKLAFEKIADAARFCLENTTDDNDQLDAHCKYMSTTFCIILPT